MNMDIVKMHLKTAKFGRPIIVLTDMIGPVDYNFGQILVARQMDITGLKNEDDLAIDLHEFLELEGHNAFAFYQFTENKIRFGSIHIDT